MSVLINDPYLAKIWRDIEDESLRAMIKHGGYTCSTDRRAMIVAEEAGEVLKETLDLGRVITGGPGPTARWYLMRIRAELVQTASAAIRFIEALDKEGEALDEHQRQRASDTGTPSNG